MKALITILILTTWHGSATAESVALDRDGNLFATISAQVAVIRIAPDGTERVFDIHEKTIPAGAFGALGLHVDHAGNMYVAVDAFDRTNWFPAVANGVWIIRPDGSTRKLPGTGSIPFPNDVTLDRRGNVYTTDSTGAIWISKQQYKWRNRQYYAHAETWVQDDKLQGAAGFPGANGIVYSRVSGRRGEIIVANSAHSSLYAIPIRRNGNAGEFELIAGGSGDPLPNGVPTPLDFRLAGIDGIDVDRFGDILAVTPIAGIDFNDFSIQFGPAPILSISRATGDVFQIPSTNLMHPATDVAPNRTYGDGKQLWVASPGFLNPPGTGEPNLREVELLWQAIE